MKIINLTPHNVVVFNEDKKIEFPASGKVARLATNEVVVGEVMGIKTVKTQYGDMQNVPTAQELIDNNEAIIVSIIMLPSFGEEYKGRVFAPNTSPSGVVRNDKGEILGVKSFISL